MLAGDERQTTTDLNRLPQLVQQLLEDPRPFGFFQAVGLLGKAYPGRPEPGQSESYDQELIHFRTWPSLTRSPTDLRMLERIADVWDPVEYLMEVSFMGLYGLSSPTPSYFWEYICRHPESPLREFLDIFNTRAIGLFYQAWKRYRWQLHYRGSTQDPVTRRVFCLMGLGTEQRPTRPDLDSDSLERMTTCLVDHPSLDILGERTRLLAYAGMLAQYTKPPVNLRSLLWDYFDGPDPLREEFVEIEENVLQWAYLAEQDYTRVGQQNSRSGAGCSFIAGTRVPDRMGTFRIHVGPLSFARFCSFLPDGEAFARLCMLAKLGSPFGTEFDVQLRLKPEEVPEWNLGTGPGGRLGWTSWSGSEPRSEPGLVLLRPVTLND